MTTYEIQGGLIMKPGTDECAGYIWNVQGQGAYDPTGKIKVGNLELTQAEVDAHNKILGEAETKAAVKNGKGLFYFTEHKKDICYTNGRAYAGKVANWIGNFKAPWVYAEKFQAAAWGGGIDAFNIWFTGPDGKKWYGVLKGDTQAFTARRLKKQDK